LQLCFLAGFLSPAMKDNAPDSPEFLWRGPLTDTGRAALRAQPELESDARLTASLAKIPDVPVSSNFTHRVMQAIELEEARAARKGIFRWNWHAVLPRIAVAMAVLVLGGVSFQHYETAAQRNLLARNIAEVASAHPLPSVDALQNYDAIQRMSQPARADNDLLAICSP
jgi:hypothetical protein